MKTTIITTIATASIILGAVYIPYIVGVIVTLGASDNTLILWLLGFFIVVAIAILIKMISEIWLSIHETIKKLTSDEDSN